MQARQRSADWDSRVAEARYSVGKAMQADIFRAQTQLSILQTGFSRWKQDRRAREAELNSLLNRRPGSPLGFPARDDVQPLTSSLEEILAEATASAPIIRREQKHRAERTRVNLARKQFRPDYTIAAGYFNMGRSPTCSVPLDIPLPSTRTQADTGYARASAPPQ